MRDTIVALTFRDLTHDAAMTSKTPITILAPLLSSFLFIACGDTTEDQVLKYVFGPLCDQVLTETKHQSSLSHGRELTIKWSSGATSVIRLDQGLGFLRSQETKHFNFRASSVEQAEEIRNLQVHVNVHESESFAVLQTT